MLQDLGIGYMAARSPQAKGRIERLWQTFRRFRLIKDYGCFAHEIVPHSSQHAWTLFFDWDVRRNHVDTRVVDLAGIEKLQGSVVVPDAPLYGAVAEGWRSRNGLSPPLNHPVSEPIAVPAGSTASLVSARCGRRSRTNSSRSVNRVMGADLAPADVCHNSLLSVYARMASEQ
jgi:hypothetical protein